MEAHRIAELLEPFLCGDGRSIIPSTSLLSSMSIYLNILALWNSRINLTAIRNEEEIVTRHFGESLFAAQHIFVADEKGNCHLIDVGSGAGFPGLPIKMWKESVNLTLIESNHKKATFLREVVRGLNLENVEVFDKPADLFSRSGDVVTLRAVEQFEDILPVAAKFTKPGGRLALLIGEAQARIAIASNPWVGWLDPIPVPQSTRRILLIGVMNRENQESG